MHAVTADDPLKISLEDFQEDFVGNTGSVLVAAKEAVQGCQRLPSDIPKTFIYTGNFLNFKTMPALMSAGVGKSATAHLLQVAHESYAAQKFRSVKNEDCMLGIRLLTKRNRFYYADERKADGFAAFLDVNGPYHAEHYLSLAESKEKQPWLQTFVGGQGYKDFANL